MYKKVFFVLFIFILKISNAAAIGERTTIELGNDIKLSSLILKRDVDSYFNFKLELKPYPKDGMCFRNYAEIEILGTNYDAYLKQSISLGQLEDSLDCNGKSSFVPIEGNFSKLDLIEISHLHHDFRASCGNISEQNLQNDVKINYVCKLPLIKIVKTKDSNYVAYYQALDTGETYSQRFKIDGTYKIFRVIYD
ncbi:hypothetical protein L9G16_17960 [Shewanella sp. A25]|nr:hypothetical protein [Shewanella shenzhenensis]